MKNQNIIKICSILLNIKKQNINSILKSFILSKKIKDKERKFKKTGKSRKGGLNCDLDNFENSLKLSLNL